MLGHQRPALRQCSNSHSAPFSAWHKPRANQLAQCRWHNGSRKVAARALAARSSDVELVATVAHLLRWLQTYGAQQTSNLEPKRFRTNVGERVGLIACRDVQQGEVLLEVPESFAVTAIDAEQHELIGHIAKECSELVAMTLWLMAERSKGSESAWSLLLQTLPDSTASPLLWEDQEWAELLTGSPVLTEARNRQSALQQQWTQLVKHFQQDADKYNQAVFNEAVFVRTFCVVLASTSYLPSAQCFAIVPAASCLGRTGNDNGCTLDYDTGRQTVMVVATRPYREGQEVLINDGRPNGELLLSTGTLQDANMSDCLYFPASLIAADRYYSMKAQLLESFGFGPEERFPVYADRFPIQLLSYLRLSRIQDPGQFAQVTFEQDVIISQLNEYEVLQLLMGECRELLARYKTSLEEDTKTLQRADLTGRERLAARLRVAEKTILGQTMDAVRRRLAPIRGIPTKSGRMTDPNADIREVFDFIEELPKKPAQLIDNIKRWAKGEYDPDWNK
eukprot:GHRR01015744.1.p1 GENE.GHRR01015744.1~~GHRR01015744.1.p1  ORF type:complete len:507 (+),score=158.49 GHRR01015744.1:326-1846(+)